MCLCIDCGRGHAPLQGARVEPGDGVGGASVDEALPSAAIAGPVPFWALLNTLERLKSATIRKYEAQAAAVYIININVNCCCVHCFVMGGLL